MTAALAHPRWASAPGGSATSWRFGREVLLSSPQGDRAVLQWLLQRNCSITPRQLGGVYLSLCVFSLAIAAVFYWQGAPLVLAFAGLELSLVGVALLVYARHAGDGEMLTLDGHSLQVEQRVGPRVERSDFAAEWVSVEPAAGQGSLVELSAQGRTVRVGRFLRPELRGDFARELRLALRRARA